MREGNLIGIKKGPGSKRFFRRKGRSCDEPTSEILAGDEIHLYVVLATNLLDILEES